LSVPTTLRPVLPAGIEPGPRFDDWAPTRPAYVVCDVDGTLIGPDELATAGVVAAVGRAARAGIAVGYATGRMRDAVAALHDQLGTPGPHVLHNGAEVRAAGATVHRWPLQPDQVDGLLAIAHVRTDAYVEIYTESGFVASARDERAAAHWDLLGAGPRQVITRAADLRGEAVLKATFAVFDPDAVDELVEAVAALGLSPGPAGSPRTPDLTYVNATHPDADKGRAVLRAAAHVDVPMSAVVAIGDAANDVSMLERVGTAIAMGQADAATRAAAHLLAPEVAADGAAVALDAVIGWQSLGDAAVLDRGDRTA
jgi:Cof subfamily protein (haloacid dehalogenase superfamily)